MSDRSVSLLLEEAFGSLRGNESDAFRGSYTAYSTVFYLWGLGLTKVIPSGKIVLTEYGLECLLRLP